MNFPLTSYCFLALPLAPDNIKPTILLMGNTLALWGASGKNTSKCWTFLLFKIPAVVNLQNVHFGHIFPKISPICGSLLVNKRSARLVFSSDQMDDWCGRGHIERFHKPHGAYLLILSSSYNHDNSFNYFCYKGRYTDNRIRLRN